MQSPPRELENHQLIIDRLKTKLESCIDKHEHRNPASTTTTDDHIYMLAYLGRGSFGTVSLVKWNFHLCALKSIEKSNMSSRSLERIHIERELLVAMKDNPRVAKLYKAFQNDTHLFLLMEFIPGGDLSSVIAKYKEAGLGEENTRVLMSELVSALEAMHKLGYCHRDLKPDNILIGLDGHVKLIDFGLSKKLANNGRMQQAFSIVGTFPYIAPEVILRRGYGLTTDFWSLGILMYECLAGEPPFTSNSEIEAIDTCRKIVRWYHYLEIPDRVILSVSSTCVNFLLGLLNNADVRLGRNGVQELQTHPWLKGVIRTDDAQTIPSLFQIDGIDGISEAMNKVMRGNDNDAEVIDQVIEKYAQDTHKEGHHVGKGRKHFRLDKNKKFIGYSYSAQLLAPLHVDTSPDIDFEYISPSPSIVPSSLLSVTTNSAISKQTMNSSIV